MNYHDIKTNNMDNGDGLRVVVWLSGCNHKCKGCQNPETWDPNSGKLFGEKEKEYIFKELEKDYISGITLTGGDPIHPNNVYEVYELIKEIKDKFYKKTVWIYTGYDIGYMFKLDIPYDFLLYIDILVTGVFIEQIRDTSLMWRGSANQLVIDINKTIDFEKVGFDFNKKFKIVSHIELESQVEKIFTDIRNTVIYE